MNSPIDQKPIAGIVSLEVLAWDASEVLGGESHAHITLRTPGGKEFTIDTDPETFRSIKAALHGH